MNEFEYKILIKKIDKLTTKKSKKEMLNTLKNTKDYYSFKAVTYLIKKHSLELGTADSNKIKKNLLALYLTNKYYTEDIIEYCDSDYTISPYHFKKMVDSRYTTFQLLAYVLTHIKEK